MTCRKKVALSIIFISSTFVYNSTKAMNIPYAGWPYDTLIRPTFPTFNDQLHNQGYNQRHWQLYSYIEGGVNHAKGFNEDGELVTPLRIWNRQQNALAMLEGFPQNSPITQLRSALLDADNGIRGRFDVCGELLLNFNIAFAARYFFANDWSLSAYLPVSQMTLKDVAFVDQTPNLDNLDKLVHRLLTDNLAQNVQQ